MKPALTLFLLGIFFQPVCAQEEMSVEEVLKKLEVRVAPIESITGRFRTDGSGEISAQLDWVGWIGVRPGKYLRRETALWKFPEGVFLREDFYTPSSIASRGLFSGTRQGEGLTYAFKTKPEAYHKNRGGMPGMMEMMVGSNWAIWEVALWPRQLISQYTDLKAYREENFVVITGNWSIPMLMGPSKTAIKLLWYFDASTYRIEKLVIESGQVPLEITCQEYISIKGVEIPSKVEFVEMMMIPMGQGRGQPRVSMILDQVQSPALPGELERPSWLEDPALPEATDSTPAELEEQLKADPENGALLIEFGNRVVLNSMRGGARDMNKWAGTLASYTGSALKAHPESGLLRLSHYVGRVMEEKKVPGDLLEEIVREGSLAFDALTIAMMASMSEERYEEGKTYLSRIPVRGVGGEFRKRVGFHMELTTLKSVEDFMQRIVGELEGLSVPEKLTLLGGIAQPVRRFGRISGPLAGKSVEFLKELADSGKPEFLLLAARGYAGQADHDATVRLFILLADHPEYASRLGKEFQELCKKGGENAIPLVEKIVDTIDDPELLLIAAQNAFEKKRELQFGELKKRLVKVCSAMEADEVSFRSYRDPAKLTSLLQSLVDADRIEEAKEFLLAYINKTNGSNYLYGKGKELLPRILADDFAAKYRFLKYAGPQSPDFFKTINLSITDFLSEVRRRVESGTFEKSDLDSLGLVITTGGYLKNAEGFSPEMLASIFRKGLEKYPEEGTYFERMGDALCFGKDYAGAIAAYNEVLRLRKVKGKQNVMGEMVQTLSMPIMDGSPPQKDGFDPSEALLSKMAYAHQKAGDKEGAVRTIEQFLKDFPEEEGISEAADAYRVLKMEARILPLKSQLFLKQVKNEGRIGWGDPAVTTGLELIGLYMKAEKYIEAKLVAGLLEKRRGQNGNRQTWNEFDQYLVEIRGKLTQEMWIGEFLKMKFDPISQEQKGIIDELIEQMDDDQIDLRDEAYNQLKKMGPAISPYLAGELEGQGAEVASRMREILAMHAEKALRERYLKE